MQSSEERARISEERFRTLFEAAGDAIFLLDGDTFVACNAQAVEVFHCPRQGIIGHRWAEMSPSAQPDGGSSEQRAAQEMKMALEGGTQRFTWRYLRCDGEPFDAEVTLVRVDLDGKPHLQAIVRDITERERLQHEQERLLAIVENSPDYIAIADSNLNAIYLNDSFKRVLPQKYRIPGNAAEPIPYSVFYPSAAVKMITEVAIPYAVRHGSWQDKTELLDANGKPFPVLQTIIAHLSPDGTLEYLSTIARDLSMLMS